MVALAGERRKQQSPTGDCPANARAEARAGIPLGWNVEERGDSGAGGIAKNRLWPVFRPRLTPRIARFACAPNWLSPIRSNKASGRRSGMPPSPAVPCRWSGLPLRQQGMAVPGGDLEPSIRLFQT